MMLETDLSLSLVTSTVYAAVGSVLAAETSQTERVDLPALLSGAFPVSHVVTRLLFIPTCFAHQIKISIY